MQAKNLSFSHLDVQDGMPLTRIHFQYKTCPTKQLFPFESIDQEQKQEISEAYGMIFLDIFDSEESA